ncbi:MAG: ThiF family adenylyltransferase [Firmicutes bacterium]|nr:ThiF family adenylyltransferase [Bacillota bacterium]
MIRYKENIDEFNLTEKIQNQLLTKNIAVIGCGGQGGYTLEFLIRLGIKSIIFWDGDYFEESNLNRQIGCLIPTLQKNKALSMKERLQQINPEVELICCDWYFGDKEDDKEKLSKVDFIFDAADCNYNIFKLRTILREVIIEYNIPIIRFPINILGGYVHIETMKDLSHFDFITHRLIYQNKNEKIFPEAVSQPAYKCAIIAGEAVNQMVQYFSNCRYAAIDTTLNIDLYHHKYVEEDRFGIIP